VGGRNCEGIVTHYVSAYVARHEHACIVASGSTYNLLVISYGAFVIIGCQSVDCRQRRSHVDV